MDFNFSEIVIDRPYRAHKFDLTGKRVWTATQIQDLTLELGGETVFATDATGANIMGFDRSKTASVSFSNALMHLGVLADQIGTEAKFASSSDKLVLETVETISVAVAGSGAATATLSHTPKAIVDGVPFQFIDKISSQYVTMKTFEIGADAAANFSVSGATITLPTGETWAAGDKIVVKYQYESEEGVAINNESNVFTSEGEFIIEAFCYNPCDKANKKLLSIIFPNGKEDAAVSLTISNELTHPVTINAVQDYCSEDKRLFRIEAANA